MARRFTPVSDPERARCEQDEESLRKHRKFDTPFAMLPSDLNEKKQTGHEDMRPLGRKASDLEQDEKGLWRKKAELFDKQKTWGRETMEYSNPEQARAEGNTGPKWGRPGTVGWGTQGSFGGRGEDRGLSVLQRGEVDQAMEKNEKGLWVRKKAEPGQDDAAEAAPAKKGHWRCAKCGLETSVSLEFCRKFECGGQRPRGAPSDSSASARASNPNEDPRLEAAKRQGRGTKDAAQQALKALEERRKKEQQEKERLGMTRRPDARAMSRGGDVGGGRAGVTLNSSSQQVKPAQRLKNCSRWQGVQRTDEEAQKVVGKALGGDRDAMGPAKRVEDSDRSVLRGRRSAKAETSVYDDIATRIEEEEAARARSRSRSPAAAAGGTSEEVVVDFF